MDYWVKDKLAPQIPGGVGQFISQFKPVYWQRPSSTRFCFLLKKKKNVHFDRSLLQFSWVLPVFLVDLITKADGVDDSQLEAHVTLLQFVGVGLECDSRLAVLRRLTLKLGIK